MTKKNKKSEKRSSLGVNFRIPCLLSSLIGEVGTGAMLKSVIDDNLAVVVDYIESVEEGNWFVVCGLSKAGNKVVDESSGLPCKIKHYCVEKVTTNDFDKWIVLHAGQDEYVLVD